MALSSAPNISNFLVSLVLAILLSLVWLSGCAPAGIYHTIQPGQTLYRIAKTYNISETELARVNRIKDPTALRVGQKLYIPGATRPRRVKTVSSPKPARTPTASTPAVSAAPKISSPAAKPPAARPSQNKSVPAASARKGSFAWPVKGKVVGRFGTQGGTTRKGIEIACAQGGSVVAASPGKVIYSGRGIRGYGNLIIIEHADDYFTVYGYNEKNLVKTNDFVGEGDRIALCGGPQNSQSSRLHFEIRKGKSAVDPIFYLP